MSCYIQHTLQKLDSTTNHFEYKLGELLRSSPFCWNLRGTNLLFGFAQWLSRLKIRVIVNRREGRYTLLVSLQKLDKEFGFTEGAPVDEVNAEKQRVLELMRH